MSIFLSLTSVLILCYLTFVFTFLEIDFDCAMPIAGAKSNNTNNFYLVTTITNNTQTIYIDNMSDSTSCSIKWMKICNLAQDETLISTYFLM